MEKKSNHFSGQLGFVLAAAGSAVGVGNLWRFPYLAAKDGGGLFLIIYLILVLTFGFTLLTSDIAIGRRTQKSAIGAYTQMHPRWKFLGILTFLVPVLIMTYYAVIGGWITKYAVVYLTGQAQSAAQDNYFTSFITSPVSPVIFALLFMGVTAFIVYNGVQGGIEKVSKFMMPVLLVLVVVIPLMVLVIGILMKVCTKLFETMQTKIDNLNNTLQENLVAIRVVKAFVREGYERIKFKKSNDELMDAALAVGLRIIAIMPVMMLALNGATVAVLYFGGGMVMGGTFELGDLQAFINYIVQILMSVMMVAMSLLQLSRAQACAHRIKEVLETEPSVENKPEGEICRAALPGEAADGTDHVLPAPRGEVEFRDVSFKYVASGSGDDVLSHISFHVRPGQFVAIVGGTGTGKSTLVNLIPRFYDVTGGQVLLDGVDVRDYPLEELRGRIGQELAQALAAQPDNGHLRRQSGKLYQTQISTIHAFCTVLLRQWGHLLDVPADFALCEEEEAQVLMDRTLNQVLEARYEEVDPEGNFARLLDILQPPEEEHRAKGKR